MIIIAPPSTELSQACGEAFKVALDKKESVSFEFNGVNVVSYPEDRDGGDAAERYTTELYRRARIANEKGRHAALTKAVDELNLLAGTTLPRSEVWQVLTKLVEDCPKEYSQA